MKKIAALVLAGAMLLGTLAACGKDEKPKETTSAAKPETTTQAPEQEVEIVWWAFPTFSQENADDAAGTYEKKIIEAFEAKNKGIKVRLETIDYKSGPEKIKTAIEAGTIADVLIDAPGRIIEYGKAGKLAELGDLFTPEYIKDINNDAIVNACKGNDKFYMYPLGSTPFTMAFNKAAVEKVGGMDLLNLKGDRTWKTENFVKLLEKLHEGGFVGGSVFCKSQGGDQGTRAFITNLANGSMTDKEMTKYVVNDEAGVKGLTLAKELVSKDLMTNGAANAGGDDVEHFAIGQTSFTTLWSATLQAQQKKNLEQAGVEAISVPFPSETGKPALEYYLAGMCIFNNGDDAKIAAAKKFVQFVCSDPEWAVKNAKNTKTFPVQTSLGNIYEGDEMMTYLNSLVPYYAPYFQTMDGYAKMRTLWFPMLQAVLNGDEEPKAALDKFVEQANAAIKEAQ